MDIDEPVVSGERLYQRLAKVFPCDFRYVAETGSTNSLLKEQIQLGQLTRSTLLYTNLQTHGRGTRGRIWYQPAEDLQRLGGLDIALSAAIPQVGPRLASPQLSLFVGGLVAVLAERALYQPDIAAEMFFPLPPLWSFAAVKWPNDLLVQTAAGWRKAGGILIETTTAPDSIRWVIIGLGLNVNSLSSWYPPEIADQVGTLREWQAHISGQPDNEVFLQRDMLLFQFAGELARFVLGQGLSDTDLLKAWHARNRTAGTRYTFTRGDEHCQVTAVEVDGASGGLWVEDAAGRRWLVSSYSELAPPENPAGGAL